MHLDNGKVVAAGVGVNGASDTTMTIVKNSSETALSATDKVVYPGTADLVVKCKPAGGTAAADSVTWNSNNSSVVSVTPNSGDSKIATLKFLAPGAVTITMTATGNDGKTYSDTVDITVKKLPAVVLDKTTARVIGTGTVALSATADLDEAETAAANTATYAWESSDTDVATVSNGTVTGVAKGTATITVTMSYNSKEATATCEVTVGDAATLTGTAPTGLYAGGPAGELAVTYDAKDTGVANPTYTATSSAEATATVAVVDGKVMVTPLAAGTTDITVTAKDAGGNTLATSGTISVTVGAAATLTGTAPSNLYVGGDALELTLSYNAGGTGVSDPTYEVVSNSDSAKATVAVEDGKIMVTPVAAGTTDVKIAAKSGTTTLVESASITITVGAAPTLSLGNAPADLQVGQGAKNVAITYNAGGTGVSTPTYTATSGE